MKTENENPFTNESKDEFMGTLEASKLWGVSQATVRRWCCEGLIEAYQDEKGSPWRIPRNCKKPGTIGNLFDDKK